MPHSNTPWTCTKASPNGPYQDSWICAILSGGGYIGFINGTTREQCDGNAQLIINAVNNYYDMRNAVSSICEMANDNSELRNAQMLAMAVLKNIPITPIPIFNNSLWSKKRTEAVSAQSDAFVAELINQTKGPGKTWMNSYQYSTPIYWVDSNTPKVPVAIVQNGNTLSSLALHQELQKGVPIPVNALPAAGTDGTITFIDVDSLKLYEFWQFAKVNGQWQANWGGIINNVQTDGVMPIVNGEHWGATATSLPASAGMILLSELASGAIPHALAFAIPSPKYAFVSPANRSDGDGDKLIPEGTAFKFPADIVIDPSWCPMIKMMVTAVRDYGMILRDRSGCVNFYAEDPTQYGFKTDPYLAYYNGLQLWDIILQFPWDKLKAIEPIPAV